MCNDHIRHRNTKSVIENTNSIMATKDQLYQIIAAFGLGKALPSGSTRAAARLAVRGMIRGGRVLLPTVGRVAGTGRMVAGTVARRHPVGAGVLGFSNKCNRGRSLPGRPGELEYSLSSV